MNNKHKGGKRDYPKESRTAGHPSGRDDTRGAGSQNTPPREDAADATRIRSGCGPRQLHSTDTNPESSVATATDAEQSVLLTDGGVDEEIRAVASDLTKFQLRCLATLARQDRHGIGIREVVEEYYGEEQTHGRLYPNLDQLVEKGVVEKSERDRRTNNYALTETGRR
ncbi:hypothetical protein EA472_22435, partial [Natrarchaeobius oligotrophus]